MSEGKNAWPLSESATTYTAESKAGEKKSAIVMLSETRKVKSIANLINIKKFSSLLTLLRVTAWVQCFIYDCCAKSNAGIRMHGRLTRTELQTAQNDWVREAQNCLKQQENFDQLKVQFSLIEEQGITKCVGRLTNSDLGIEAQKPIILPCDHKLTEMIIIECHAGIHHGGVRTTLTELRSRFWVPKGRQTIKKVLWKCVTCKRCKLQHCLNLEQKKPLCF